VQDKRQHRRVVLDVNVLCQLEATEPFPAVAKDISLGGMSLASEVRPEVGAAVTLEAQLPGQTKAIQFPAFVRWVTSDGFGVQFGLLGAKATHAITRLIR
jgi:hypothetical protein